MAKPSSQGGGHAADHPLIVHRAELTPLLTAAFDKVCNPQLRNGIHFIALSDRSGMFVARQSDPKKDEEPIWQVSDQRLAIQYISTVLRPTLERYHELIGQPSSVQLPEDIAGLRRVRGIRITLDNTHVFVTALDKPANHFILAISWNAQDYGPWTFVGPVNSAISAREEICRILMDRDSSLFRSEDYIW